MKNALVVIDIQEALLNKHTQDLPKKIADFIDYSDFNFVLFTKFVNDINSNWVKIWNWKEMFKEKETEIVSELKRFTTEDNVFVKKAAFSVFKAKGFEDFLEEKEINEVFMCGMDTNACVYVSVFEAFSLGYKVKLLRDLCASSFGDKYHKMALELLDVNMGKKVVIESKDLK